jgi:hypothetical protein
LLEDESLLNYHISLLLSKMDNQSAMMKQTIVEHCNFVYLSLLLLFKTNSNPTIRENKKCTDFILENIIENTFILLQGENSLFER